MPRPAKCSRCWPPARTWWTRCPRPPPPLSAFAILPSFSLKSFMLRLLPGSIPGIAERCHSCHGRPNMNSMLLQQHSVAVNVVPTCGIIAG